MISENLKIVDTTPENIIDHGICGYKSLKTPGFQEKVNWYKERFNEGLRIKSLFSEKDGNQGMIEYIPGEFCWRPVDAKGYMFIHCIFLGFRKIYKGKGWGTKLIEECIKETRKAKMKGVAVVTRSGSFMAGKELFLKNGFEIADTAPPDFELLVKKFKKNLSPPQFKSDRDKRLKKYGKGLTILRSDKCPYSVKNVLEITDCAEKTFKIKSKVITLKNYKEAQDSPCAFGTFCIVYNGEVIADHPISKTHFSNIINKISR